MDLNQGAEEERKRYKQRKKKAMRLMPFQMQIQLIMPLTLSCAEPDLYHFFFREEVEKGQRANPHLLQKDFPNPKESSTMTSASSKEEPLESSLKEGRML